MDDGGSAEGRAAAPPPGAAVDVAAQGSPPERRSLQRIMKLSAVAMCTWAPTGVVLEANQAFCDLLGYHLDDLRGSDWAGLTHPADADVDEVRVGPFGRLDATLAGLAVRVGFEDELTELGEGFAAPIGEVGDPGGDFR